MPLHQGFAYTMKLRHACGAELLIQGIEWPPRVVVCSECREALGLIKAKSLEEARFKVIGTVDRQEP